MTLEATLSRLKSNDTTLTSVNLASSQIDDVGAARVAETLKVSRILTRLDLRNNNITNAGAEALSLALQGNHVLIAITLTGNSIEQETFQSFSSFLERNRQISFNQAKLCIINDQFSKAVEIANHLFPYAPQRAIIIYKHLLTLNPAQWDIYYRLAELAAEPAEQSHILLKGALHAIERKEYKIAQKLAEAAQEHYSDLFIDRLTDLEILQRQKVPIKESLHGLSRVYKKRNALSQELKVWKILARVNPDPVSYRKVIDIYKQLGKHLKAEKWTTALSEMEKSTVVMNAASPPIISEVSDSIVPSREPATSAGSDSATTKADSGQIKDTAEASSTLHANPREVRTLHQAVCARDLNAIRALLFDRTCNSYDRIGYTALHHAAMGDDQDVLKLLLTNKNINRNPRCRYVHMGNIQGRTPLHLASMRGIPEMIQILLSDSKIDPNTTDQESGGTTPLQHTSGSNKGGNLAGLKALLKDSRVDRNASHGFDENAPLHWAVTWGEEGIEQTLLDDTKVQRNPRNKDGQTPFHLIMELVDEPLAIKRMKLLLDDKKVNRNAHDLKGNTALNLAVKHPYSMRTQKVQLLLADLKVDPNIEDAEGEPPLHSAINMVVIDHSHGARSKSAVDDDLEILKLLVASARVNPKALNKKGMSPLESVRYHNNQKALEILLASPRTNPPWKFYVSGDCWTAAIGFMRTQDPVFEILASQSKPYASLEALVEAEVRKRHQQLSKNPNIRKEISCSTVNRPNLHLSLVLKSDMAKVFNIDSKIKFRVADAVEKAFPDKLVLASNWLFIGKIVDFFLEQLAAENLDFLLENEMLTKLEPKLNQVLFDELMAIRTELFNIFGVNYKFSHENGLNSLSYYIGQRVEHLTFSIAAGGDATNGHLLMGCNVFSKNGNRMLCSVGRPDSDQAAMEQARLVFLGCLETNSLPLPNEDGTYDFYYVVSSFYDSSLFPYFGRNFEEERLLKEVETIKGLDGTILELKDKVQTYKFVCHPIHFVRNVKGFGQDKNPGKETSDVQSVITSSFLEFRKLIKNKIDALEKVKSLDAETKTFILDTLDKIEKEGNKFKAHEGIYLRNLICQLLNIPMTYPSLHNDDAAAFSVMISSALHQWMDLSVWLGQHRIGNIPSDVIELLDDYRFRDLVWGNAMILQQMAHYAFSENASEVPKHLDSLVARESVAKKLNYLKILPRSIF